VARPPAIEVDLTADGEVPRGQARAARELLASLGHFTSHPITGARLTLRHAGPGRSGRPYLADASVLADGRLLAAHATGESAERAAELVTERLRRQLLRIEGAEVALRNEPRVIERALKDLEVDLGGRPEAAHKPPEERLIVHRHTYLDVPLSTLEAVAELLDLDLSFFLFRHVRTGEDVVVHHHDDGHVGLLFPPGSALADENDIVTPEPSRYDEPLALAKAREEMDWLNHRFLYFVDAEDGRGRVLYLRHDGDYGLVQPSDHR
jgi:Sigma 54 modulation/S30EA ribosomal protein C terminus